MSLALANIWDLDLRISIRSFLIKVLMLRGCGEQRNMLETRGVMRGDEPMLAVDRQREISKIVQQSGSIRVKELSQLLHVTQETIRKDLDVLGRYGMVLRSHGGAVRVDEEHSETPLPQRDAKNVEEKKRIAHVALNYIDPCDRIILDASTTALHVARILPDIPLTVLTNSLKVAVELSDRDKVEVISTGGILRSSSLSYVGPTAENTLLDFHVNKAFISCKGLHQEYGLTESDGLQAMVKRKMIQIADKVHVLADHSKIGVRDFTTAASLQDVHLLITDDQTTKESLTAIQPFCIELIQASQDFKMRRTS